MKPLSHHWADQTAARIVRVWGELEQYNVASGITPSGVVHIGNFREVITVDFVNRALLAIGKKVRFLYSWDDFDTFRKVPKNLPNQEMLAKHLREPISRVPDAYGKLGSYAEHNIRVFENELRQVGIKPEYLYQHERYSAGMYAKDIRAALENRDKIKAILDEHRTSPLPDNYLPTSIYCEKCDRDEMEYERYEGEWNYGYKCSSCGHEAVTDIRTTKNLKLNWRTDWPMRWNFEQVHFEPGGKDHSSQGGSYDTAKTLVKEVWHRNPPEYLQYDFVSIKGGTGKMSSSSGELLTLTQALVVYDPMLIRWIFANQKPNKDFSLAFDIDVIKVYDEFDRAEAQLFAAEGDTSDKMQLLRRTYELSQVAGMPQRAPFRAPFRELTNYLQICDGNIERTQEKFYAGKIRDEQDQVAFNTRAQKALGWLENYAPEEFRYTINSKPLPMDLTPAQGRGVEALKTLVKETDLDAIDGKDLNQLIYDKAVRGAECDAKELFQAVYRKLINRDQGPRLPSFLKELGKERVLSLL